MELGLENVTHFKLVTKQDERGNLTIWQTGIKPVHYTAPRVFMVWGTPEDVVRGNHAHKQSWQTHICTAGKTMISLDDGAKKAEVVLDSPQYALLLGPLVWHSFILSAGASLTVITSNLYEEDDYVRSYEEFKKLTAHRR